MTKRAAGRIGRHCPGCGNGRVGMGGGYRYCPCGWTDKPKELRGKKSTTKYPKDVPEGYVGSPADIIYRNNPSDAVSQTQTDASP